MDNDINGDEAMQRFEDLGRKLFQAPNGGRRLHVLRLYCRLSTCVAL